MNSRVSSGVSTGYSVEADQPAALADRRRHAGGQVEVGRVARHDLEQDL